MTRSLSKVVRGALQAAARAYPQEVGGKHWDLERRLLARLSGKLYFTKHDLVEVAKWKTQGRTVPRLKTNDEGLVRDLTRISFATADPALAIQTLVEGI